MKKLVVFFALLLAVVQVATAEITDTTGDIIWQKYIWPKMCGDVKFSPDGKYIYAAISYQGQDSPGNIVILSTETGDSVGVFEGQHNGVDQLTMDISALGNYIVTHDYQNQDLLWDCNKKKLVKNFTDTYSSTGAICISPDEKYILFHSISKNTIVVYDPVADKEITRFQCNGTPQAIKFSHDGTKFALCTIYYDDYEEKEYVYVSIWETGTWKQEKELYAQQIITSNISLKFSPNDKLLSFIRGSRIGFIFNINNNKVIFVSDTNSKLNYCSNIEFLGDNNYCLLQFSNINGEDSFDILNIDNKQTIKQYSVHDGISDCLINSNLVIANGWYNFTLLKPTITSVKESEKSTEIINIYQQNEKLVLELTTSHLGNSNLEIIDLLGNIIYKQELGFISNTVNTFTFDALLSSGVYFAKINIGDYSISQKFSISK